MIARTLGLLLILMAVALAQTPTRQETVKFAPGKSSATLKRGIARGETLKFLLEAGKGQTMTVSVTSVENNAEFDVIGDGGPLGHSQAKGKAQVWSGKLPIKGTYAIEVGATRGGAEFTLDVSVR